MQTKHVIYYRDARALRELADQVIHLVVTSPPYPMISMWDAAFFRMNNKVRATLSAGDGMEAFRLMHEELSKVWREIYRVLVPGGFACINIGDATRNIKGDFRLYPNHGETLTRCSRIGFETLPEVIWRKPTNSPTKFLGSGTLPCGGYVTLEHEVILILRKPGRRDFQEPERHHNRRKSSFFWEERNKWFSDSWELNGIRQALESTALRKRSGAYPIEIPLRLINMYSSKTDTVLDPFLGTGTTTLAAIALLRNSVGYEIETGFSRFHWKELLSSGFLEIANDLNYSRLRAHAASIDEYRARNRIPKYRTGEGIPVFTRQEVDLTFERVKKVIYSDEANAYLAEYEPFQPSDYSAVKEAHL